LLTAGADDIRGTDTDQAARGTVAHGIADDVLERTAQQLDVAGDGALPAAPRPPGPGRPPRPGTAGGQLWASAAMGISEPIMRSSSPTSTLERSSSGPGRSRRTSGRVRAISCPRGSP